jgi:hypothetical protein
MWPVSAVVGIEARFLIRGYDPMRILRAAVRSSRSSATAWLNGSPRWAAIIWIE